MQSIPVVIAVVLIASALPAQRGKPTLDWQKRTTTIDYGAVPLGKHGLEELKVGDQWRLGMNEASKWSLQMPVLIGDKAVPPGEYRVNLTRLDDKRCAVVLQGSHHALGGGEDLRVEGELGKTQKPAKKLSIDWVKAASKDKNTLPAQLVVQFGEHEWKGGLAVVGNKVSKVGAWQLVAFALPAATVAARDKGQVPVAVLSKGEESWNVMVGASEAKLVPWMVAPTDNNGFGEIHPPAAATITTGKLEAADAQVDKEVEFLELRNAALQKGALELQFAAGKQTLSLSLPEPDSKAKPK